MQPWQSLAIIENRYKEQIMIVKSTAFRWQRHDTIMDNIKSDILPVRRRTLAFLRQMMQVYLGTRLHSYLNGIGRVCYPNAPLSLSLKFFCSRVHVTPVRTGKIDMLLSFSITISFPSFVRIVHTLSFSSVAAVGHARFEKYPNKYRMHSVQCYGYA